MRQSILIISLVSLVMYAGFVNENSALSSAAAVPPGPLHSLEEALSSVGATLEAAEITGWAEVGGAGAAERLTSQLGWSGDPLPVGEVREVVVHKRGSRNYLAVRLVLTGSGLTAWESHYAALDRTLGGVGTDPYLAVQLEGSEANLAPQAAVSQIMALLQARDRQPWADQSAASEAGRTNLLPPSVFGVNAQAAARRNLAGGPTRIWVAWPALQQEY